MVVQVGVGDVGGAGVHQKDGRWLKEGEEKKYLIRGF